MHPQQYIVSWLPAEKLELHRNYSFKFICLYSNRLNARGRNNQFQRRTRNWSGAWKELYCLQAGRQTAAEFCVVPCLRNRWEGLWAGQVPLLSSSLGFIWGHHSSLVTTWDQVNLRPVTAAQEIHNARSQPPIKEKNKKKRKTEEKNSCSVWCSKSCKRMNFMMNSISCTLKRPSRIWVQFQIFKRNISEHVFAGSLNVLLAYSLNGFFILTF